MRAKGLRVGERFWYQGTHWIVVYIGKGEEGGDQEILIRHMRNPDEPGPLGDRVIYPRDRVYPREPHRFERQKSPEQLKRKKGKHAHQWRLVAGGLGRVCEVCGRGDVKTDKGWRRKT
jgi:hypothetical protein